MTRNACCAISDAPWFKLQVLITQPVKLLCRLILRKMAEHLRNPESIHTSTGPHRPARRATPTCYDLMPAQVCNPTAESGDETPPLSKLAMSMQRGNQLADYFSEVMPMPERRGLTITRLSQISPQSKTRRKETPISDEALSRLVVAMRKDKQCRYLLHRLRHSHVTREGTYHEWRPPF